MKLYTFSRAPHCRKVDIVLIEKQIDIERVEINLAEKENLSSAFLAINPRGVLPVLVLDNGQHIDESLAICRYLEARFPQPKLFGRSAEEIAMIASWERHMEFDGYQPAQEAFRNSHPMMADRAIPGFSAGFPGIPALVERSKKRFSIFLTRLEDRLSTNPFVAGEHFSIADITGLLAIDIAARSQMGIPDALDHTRHWYDKLYLRESISSTFVSFK